MNLKKLAVAGIIALAAWSALGCSSGPSESDGQDEGDLSNPFGGYNAADEAPAFGDPELASTMGAEMIVDDPLFPADMLDSLDDRERKNVYVLSIRWGQLEGDSANTTLTDWIGSLELVRGGIVLRHTIRFEHGQDHIVRPRTSRTLLEWVSMTNVHFDGVLVLIVDQPSDEDSAAGPNQLTFTTPLYTRTFSLEELETLEEIIDVDALGNQIAFNSRKLEQVLCGEGTLEGVWRLNPAHRNGEFFGRWVTADGVFRGHLRGHFGARPNGDKVFFGKVIGPNGHFAGLLRGTWGVNDTDSSGGWFEGMWASRAGVAIGTVGGQWQSVTGDEDGDDDGDNDHHGRGPRWGGGFFSGWWKRACDADSANSGT